MPHKCEKYGRHKVLEQKPLMLRFFLDQLGPTDEMHESSRTKPDLGQNQLGDQARTRPTGKVSNKHRNSNTSFREVGEVEVCSFYSSKTERFCFFIKICLNIKKTTVSWTSQRCNSQLSRLASRSTLETKLSSDSCFCCILCQLDEFWPDRPTGSDWEPTGSDCFHESKPNFIHGAPIADPEWIPALTAFAREPCVRSMLKIVHIELEIEKSKPQDLVKFDTLTNLIQTYMSKDIVKI